MRRMLVILLLLCLLTAAAMAESPYENAEAPLTLFAVNVGKGDALLLNCGADTYLIDTGRAIHWGELSRALKVLQVEHLTGVILTHTDKDHAGGIMALATSSIAVDAWYAPAYFTCKASKHPAVLAADVRGETVTFLRAGDELSLGTGRLRVIGPLSASEDENGNSLVLVAEAGGGRMLLTGDMESEEEAELLAAGVIPPCDVLKIAHHGKADATSDALLRAVQPRIAVLCTNTSEEPSTPSAEVLSRLEDYAVNLYQTQEAESGVLVTLDQGELTAHRMAYRDLPDAVSGVFIAAVDKADDAVTLRSASAGTIDLSGWFLLSEKGKELFVFPAGTEIAPGGELRVTSLSSATTGDLVWPEEEVWHRTKEDRAVLCDVYGREMDSYPREGE